jgi:hypothetical protein
MPKPTYDMTLNQFHPLPLINDFPKINIHVILQFQEFFPSKFCMHLSHSIRSTIALFFIRSKCFPGGTVAKLLFYKQEMLICLIRWIYNSF